MGLSRGSFCDPLCLRHIPVTSFVLSAPPSRIVIHYSVSHLVRTNFITDFVRFIGRLWQVFCTINQDSKNIAHIPRFSIDNLKKNLEYYCTDGSKVSPLSKVPPPPPKKNFSKIRSYQSPTLKFQYFWSKWGLSLCSDRPNFIFNRPKIIFQYSLNYVKFCSYQWECGQPLCWNYVLKNRIEPIWNKFRPIWK